MRLEITIEAQKPYVIEVKEPTFTIGRSDKNILRIQSDSISRTHLSVRVDQGKIFVTDLGSANGTYIDGEKLTPQQEVLWQTFFSLHLSDHVSIALAEEEVIQPETSRPKTSTTSTAKDKKHDETREVSVNKKQQILNRPAKKQAPPKKFPFSLFLTFMIMAGGVYFQTQKNKAKDEESVEDQETKTKNLEQKTEAKKQLQKINQILTETKCQTDLEKELCLLLKTKTESGEGVLFKDKRLFIFYNFNERIRNVELDPSFSFANDPERQLYLMTFMLFRPDLRNIVVTSGAESILIADMTSTPPTISKTVSITALNLNKLTMIDIETIFTSLINKQDNTLFKALVLSLIEEADAK